MRGWNRRILAIDLYCAADSGYMASLTTTTRPTIAQPQFLTTSWILSSSQNSHSPTHAMGLDLVDQLGPDQQPRVQAGLLPRRHRQARAKLAHQVARTIIVYRDGGLLVRLRDPGAEEVMLQDRDPALGRAQVERAVLG